MCENKNLVIFAGGSALSELIRALEEYLPLLLGLTKKGMFFIFILFLYFYICSFCGSVMI